MSEAIDRDEIGHDWIPTVAMTAMGLGLVTLIYAVGALLRVGKPLILTF